MGTILNKTGRECTELFESYHTYLPSDKLLAKYAVSDTKAGNAENVCVVDTCMVYSLLPLRLFFASSLLYFVFTNGYLFFFPSRIKFQSHECRSFNWLQKPFNLPSNRKASTAHLKHALPSTLKTTSLAPKLLFHTRFVVL